MLLLHVFPDPDTNVYETFCLGCKRRKMVNVDNLRGFIELDTRMYKRIKKKSSES